MPNLLIHLTSYFDFPYQATALDKGSRYFQGRGVAPLTVRHPSHEGSTDDEIF